MKKILIALVSLLGLNACNGASLLNATIPRDGYSVTYDVAYGEQLRQTLDIYVPDHLTKPAPVIVFFYGGSWQMGSKDMYRFVGQAFASRGYITVIADYQLYPDAPYPTFLKDNAKAFAWTHAHIAEYHGDPQNLYLAGHSAGGYNAAMLTLNHKYLQEAGASPSWIRGMIGLSGPYNFLPLEDPKLIEMFGGDRVASTQPIHYVTPATAKTAPMFLCWGDADDTVGAQNIDGLAPKVRKDGGSVEVHIYPDVGHIGMVLALANGFRGKAPVLNDIDHFIQTTRKH